MAKLPPCLVIGRPGSERMETFAARARATNLAFETVPAVFPEGEPPWSGHYDDASRRRQLGYPMRRGEVGCFLAHRDAWRTVLGRGWDVALVLEDDAVLEDGRLGDVGAAARLIAGRRLAVRLVSEPRPSIRVWRELGGGACLGLPTRSGNLTTAYLVTREAAAELLASSERFDRPVDDFMGCAQWHGVDVLHLEPFAARHPAGPSEIGARAKPAVGAWFKVRREWLRLGRVLRDRLGRLGSRRRLGLLLSPSEPPRAP